MASSTENQNILKSIRSAERNLLAAMLFSNDALLLIMDNITTMDFLEQRHQLIFAAVNDTKNNNKVVTTEEVYHTLVQQNKINSVGGLDYLTDVAEEYIDDEEIRHYITVVQRASQRRQLQKIVQEIHLALTKNEDVEKIIFNTEESLVRLNINAHKEGFIPASKIVQDSVARIEMLSNQTSSMIGVPSYLQELDQKTLGFQKGDLTILAARPSMGKTALALNFAINAAIEEGNHRVAFVSLEMTSRQLVERMLGTTGSINSHSIRTGKNLTSNDWQNLGRSGDLIRKSAFFIYDSPNMSLEKIQSSLRQIVHKEKIDLIIIDYLQLISITSKKTSSRQEETSMISRHLKLLARELEVPIICLSQLSRSVEKRESKRPIMSDLRDSGAIEQDADLIIFLYRDDYYRLNEPGYTPNGETELILAKHRNGPTGIVTLKFISNTGRFES